MSTDIFAFRCEKRGIYLVRINYERVVRYTFRKKGEISISKQLLEQFFAVSLVALVIFFLLGYTLIVHNLVQSGL